MTPPGLDEAAIFIAAAMLASVWLGLSVARQTVTADREWDAIIRFTEQARKDIDF